MFLKQSQLKLILFLLALILSYQESSRLYPLDYPPVFPGPGSMDQIHYLNMGLTFANHGLLGFQYNQQFAEPFANILKPSLTPNKHKLQIDVLRRQLSTYSPSLSLSSDRPPLYSFLLGLVFKIFNYSFSNGRLLNIVLFAITALLLFSLVKNITGTPPALLAYILYIYPYHTIQMTAFFMTEITTSFLICLFCCWSYKISRNITDVRLFLTGLIFGLLILSRFNFYFCVIPLLIAYFFSWKLSYQIRFRRVFLLLMGLLFILLPLFTWNIASNQRLDMFLGTHADRALLFSIIKVTEVQKSPVRQMLAMTSEYNESHAIKDPSATDWSLTHRALFWDTVKSHSFWKNLPANIEIKTKSLFSGLVLAPWEVWFYILSCFIIFFYWEAWLFPLWTIAATILLSSIISFPEFGRYLIPCFPISCLFTSIFVRGLFNTLKNKTQNSKNYPSPKLFKLTTIQPN